jgi:hypothetical protein
MPLDSPYLKGQGNQYEKGTSTQTLLWKQMVHQLRLGQHHPRG